MRVPVLLMGSLMVAAWACAPQAPPRPPPQGRFYFPTGIAQVPSASGPDGLLYVASFNEDKRFDEGSVIAVNLAAVRQPSGTVGLPPLGAPVAATGPLAITDLQMAAAAQVFIQSFAGEMVAFPMDAGVRLFVPSRGEGDHLHIIDAVGDALSCYGGGADSNCTDSAPSTTALVPPGDAGITNPASKPRAPQPYGVGISPQGQLFVTHVSAADDPINSNLNLDSYLVQFDARVPFDPSGPAAVGPGAFHSLAVNGLYSGPSNSVAIGARYAYVSGRYNPSNLNADILRLYDTATGAVTDIGVQFDFLALDTRGLALNEDETRVYIATRNPDSLLVVSVEPSTAVPVSAGGSVRVHEVRDVPLPGGPDEVQVISRKALGLGDLVAVTCSLANTVVIYDEDLGQLVADLPAVGLEPFGLALDNRGTAARLYVSNFGDGRVAAIDIPDLAQPQHAALVAHLGAPQTCYVTPTDSSCDGGTP